MRYVKVDRDKYLDYVADYPESLYSDVVGVTGPRYIRWADINGKLAAYCSLRHHRYYTMSEQEIIMNKCRNCTFSFKNTCTNNKCSHFGINFMTDFVCVDDCDGFQEIADGLRPRDVVESKSDDEWFAQYLSYIHITLSKIEQLVPMPKDYMLIISFVPDAAFHIQMVLIENIVLSAERKFCRIKIRGDIWEIK